MGGLACSYGKLGFATTCGLVQIVNDMTEPTNRQSTNQLGIKAEVRQLRAAARSVSATKEKAVRFLASTGMYTATGRLKRQFS